MVCTIIMTLFHNLIQTHFEIRIFNNSAPWKIISFSHHSFHTTIRMKTEVTVIPCKTIFNEVDVFSTCKSCSKFFSTMLYSWLKKYEECLLETFFTAWCSHIYLLRWIIFTGKLRSKVLMRPVCVGNTIISHLVNTLLPIHSDVL